MTGKYENIKIKGMVATIPDNEINNQDYFDEFGEKEVRKQIKVTGIQSRFVALNGQKAADMCIASAEKLLYALKWEREEIKTIVFVSSYPSYVVPSTAFVIQNCLGIGNDCVALDVNLACSGFVVGLQVVSSILTNQGNEAKGLLLVSDVSSESVSGDDKATSMLFSDCGTAIALEVQKEGGDLFFTQMSNGEGYRDILRIDLKHHMQFNGMEIFKFAISDVVETINQYFNDLELDREKVDFFVLHQAQKFIIDKIMNFCGLPKEKCLISYDKYGNAGCASIPLTLCEHKDKLMGRERNHVFFCGFGAGHSWGCATMDLNKDVFYLLQKSNQKYNER